MLVNTIIDVVNGRKWEIFKDAENSYSYKYYEMFNNIGWKLTSEESNYSKEAIEFEFEIQVA